MRPTRWRVFPSAALAEANNASLVAMLVERDPGAHRIVWQRLAPMVHRMLKRAFGPDYDIDDLAQDVFLALFRRAHTLREPRALKAFVISITARRIRYELRRKAAARWLSFGEPGLAQGAPTDLDAREALDRLHRILDRLSASDRTAFVLRFMEGLDVPAISGALGVSDATTKRRLTRVWQRVALCSRRDTALVEYLVRPGARGPRRRTVRRGTNEPCSV